jgi:hypothetical protein
MMHRRGEVISMQGERYPDLGGLLEAAYWHALATYRGEYASHVAIGDLFANHVRSATIACKTFPDGVVHIMVRVQARRPSAGDVYFTKALQAAGVYHVV